MTDDLAPETGWRGGGPACKSHACTDGPTRASVEACVDALMR
jgi:hypothetical protein